METMQEVMAKARKAASMIYSTCEDVEDKLHKVMESLKHEIQKVFEGARDEIYNAMEEFNMAILQQHHRSRRSVWAWAQFHTLKH